MGTNCAPLVADLFLFCYERDFMMSLSDDKHADIIDVFNTTYINNSGIPSWAINAVLMTFVTQKSINLILKLRCPNLHAFTISLRYS